MSRRPDWLLVLIGAGCLIDTVGFGMIAPIIPVYATKLGATDFQLGALFASYGITAIIMMIPFSLLSDRIGKIPIIIVGNFASCINALLYALAGSVPLLIFCRSLQGISAALTWSASFALIGDLYPPSVRGEKTGFLGIAEGVGYILGPTIGGMLSEFRGYSFPFLFWSAVAFVVSFLSIVMLKGMWSVGRRKPVVGEFGAIFFNTNIIIVCVLLVIGSACWGFVEAFYPKHLSLALGYHAGMIGILFTIAMLVYAPSRMVYGALSDKVGRKPVLIVGVLLSAIIIPFISMANTFTTIAICLAILFIAISQIYAAAFPLIADMVTFLKLKGEPYGAASGMGNLSWTLGFIIGPLTGGVIVEFLGLSRLCFIYALLLLTSALIGFLVIKEPKITEINPQK